MAIDENKKQLLKEITFSKANGDDAVGISSLISGMHKTDPLSTRIRARSPEYYKWIYFTNPAGPAVVYCAKHKGKIISTFAMVPKLFIFFGKEVIIAKTMDMFTNDDYQGLRLMSELSSRVFNDTKKNMTNMWYVTPSVNSYPIFRKKWKYKETVKLYYLIKLIDPKPLLDVYVKNKLFKKLLYFPAVLYKHINNIFYKKIEYEKIELSKCEHEINDLWVRMKDYINISIKKDYKYLKWRYIENPDEYKILGIRENDELNGVIVLKETLRRGVKFGEILDILYQNNDLSIIKKLLFVANNYFKNLGCSVIQTWAIRGSDIEKCYKSCGFILPRKEVKLLFSPDSRNTDFYSYKNWYFTQGDGNDL